MLHALPTSFVDSAAMEDAPITASRGSRKGSDPADVEYGLSVPAAGIAPRGPDDELKAALT